ncbi:hypothetical protein BDN72DRAFT_850953 [Pluteus cervinus]|uniref:Uncharacterized protein n=1 Tax=Pluteus cervinus TaxID=181527 RepID=A0ACD3A2M4_9AGAR|nr:hypothetical protein BDN72DRAFT_850953 [Pluteus cervinus]
MDGNTYTIFIDFHEMSIEKADSQIHTLQCYIQKLRVARNTLSPIHRLPPDVLLSIFALVGRRWGMHAGRSMLKITWVSHYWRELALGSPVLWSVITNSNLSCADEWLARSGSAPLSIGLFEMEQPFAAAVKRQFRSLFSNLSRTTAFHYSQCESERHELVVSKSFWKAPALLLSSLKLEEWSLQGNFLSSVPNIRTMLLKKCRFSWELSAPNYPNLTSLHISLPRSTVSVHQFIVLLHRMPSLQRLVAIEVFSPIGDNNLDIPLPLQLQKSPRLHMLKLDFSQALNPTLEFLRYALSWFTTNKTIIFCSSNLAVLEDDHLPYLLSSFSDIVSPKQLATIRLTPTLPTRFATLHINYHDAEFEQELVAFRTTLEIQINEPQRLTLPSTLQQNLALSQVEGVKFDNAAGEFDIPQLVEVFGGLPYLLYFEFQEGGLEFLLKIEPAENEMSPLLFAPLRILGVIQAEGAYEVLARILVKRKNLGYGMESVILGRKSNEWKESTLHGLGSLVDLVVQDLGPQALTIQRALFTGAESASWGSSINSFEDD